MVLHSESCDLRERYGRADEHNAPAPRGFWIEDWERVAIVVYAVVHPVCGERRGECLP